MNRLTTTSYLLLGLLARRPSSSYELAKQARRNFGLIWSRGETWLYAEPKRLAAQGLVHAVVLATGKRQRTVYTISDQGRAALLAWLGTPVAPPSLEFEAAIRAFCAVEVGSVEHLLSALETTRLAGEAMQRAGLRLAEDHLAGRSWFPERMHLSALMTDFLWRYAGAMRSWATWAEAEVIGWHGLTGEDKRDWSLKLFAEVVARAGATDSPDSGPVP
ncbi:MAG: PadR family transcriptional regulator [Dehalococcoidia bacterium]